MQNLRTSFPLSLPGLASTIDTRTGQCYTLISPFCGTEGSTPESQSIPGAGSPQPLRSSSLGRWAGDQGEQVIADILAKQLVGTARVAIGDPRQAETKVAPQVGLGPNQEIGEIGALIEQLETQEEVLRDALSVLCARIAPILVSVPEAAEDRQATPATTKVGESLARLLDTAKDLTEFVVFMNESVRLL